MEKFTGWAKTKSENARRNWIVYFNENKPQYGIDFIGNWAVDQGDNYIGLYDEEMDYPASDKEIEEALIQEAKKRGFKDGVWYKSACFGDNNQASGRLVYNKTNNTLYFDGGMLGLLFKSGQWAEIVPEEKKSIKISEMPKPIIEDNGDGTFNIAEIKPFFTDEVLGKTDGTPEYYNNEKGSIYKFCDDQKLNPWETDIVKRIVRSRKKGEWKSDLEKTKVLIDLYLKEYESEA